MKKLLLVLAVVGMVVVGSSVVANAVTINGTIDGTEWDYTGGTHWAYTDDPDEGPGAANISQQDYDASDFYITDDLTNLFFRFDVYGTPTLSGSKFYAVYIDVDENTLTGEIWGGFGADALLDYRMLSGVPTAVAHKWIGNQATGYWDAGTTASGSHLGGEIVELGATYSSLGISDPNKQIIIRGFVDGATDEPDDYILPLGYPVPEPMSLSLLGLGLLGAIGAGFRRKK